MLQWNPNLRALLPLTSAVEDTKDAVRAEVADEIYVFMSITNFTETYAGRSVRTDDGVSGTDINMSERRRVRLHAEWMFQDIIQHHPAAICLLPNTQMRGMNSRQFDRRMWRGMTCLWHLRSCDFRQAHNFALQEFEHVLMRFPGLRELLPDPADDLETDADWLIGHTRDARTAGIIGVQQRHV